MALDSIKVLDEGARDVATQNLGGKDYQVMAGIKLSLYTDDVSNTVAYYGFALPGTATSAAAWSIKKMVVSGSVTSYTWADGTSDFVNVWDNRTSYTYS